MNSREPSLPANVSQPPVVDLVATGAVSRVIDTLRAAGRDGVDPATELVLVASDASGDRRGNQPWVGLADRDTVIENLSAKDWHLRVKLRSVPAGHIAVMQFGPDGVAVGSVEIPDGVPHRPLTGVVGDRCRAPGSP